MLPDRLNHAVLTGATLTGATMLGARLRAQTLVAPNLRAVQAGGWFDDIGPDMTGANLTAANLSRAHLALLVDRHHLSPRELSMLLSLASTDAVSGRRANLGSDTGRRGSRGANLSEQISGGRY